MIRTTLLLTLLLSAMTAYSSQPLTLKGRVSARGRGVGGVAVTDGKNTVRTDTRGNYTLSTHDEAEFVYISIPSGYEIPTASGSARFFEKIDRRRQKYDFALTPQSSPSGRHRLVLIADPQVYFDNEIDSVRRAAAALKRLADDGVPTCTVVCGDIVGDINHRPLFFEPVRDALAESGLPTFYVVGNHDTDVSARTNALAKKTFKSIYGPTYYSFDRGECHVVILDDVFFTGYGYLHVGYLPEEQLRWLENDLKHVRPGKPVLVCMHIPTWSRAANRHAWREEEYNKILLNRSALYEILKPYNAHLLTAHEHYNENYKPAPHITEHVHAPLSTNFWQTPQSSDGIPAGYGIYEIEGDRVSWYYQTVDYPRERQFTAYAVGEDARKPRSVTANVWNYSTDWKVEWSENGLDKGPMTRYTGYDHNTCDYIKRHKDRFKQMYVDPGLTEHLFEAVPEDPRSEIEIRVTDPFGRTYVWNSASGYKL